MKAAITALMDGRNFLRGLGGLLGYSIAAHPMLTTVTMAGASRGKPLDQSLPANTVLRD